MWLLHSTGTNCKRRALKLNCQAIMMFLGTLGIAPTAFMPAAARLHRFAAPEI